MNRIACLILLSVLLAPRCGNSQDLYDVKISFTGDIIMHIPVKTCAANNNIHVKTGDKSENNGGFDHLFSRINGVLSRSDIVAGNMEFPVSPPFTSNPFIFNCYPEVLPALKKSGFNLLSIANNHILDQNKSGVINTISFLKQYGIGYIGAGTDEGARDGFIFEKKGIRTGFIAYTGIINTSFPKEKDGIYINNFYKKERVFEDIDAIRRKCDFLVMIVHTGNEYATAPAERDIYLCREYLNRGVDLIIGHHPHILQYVEQFRSNDGRTCHIFYSLGNFISNQSGDSEIHSSGIKLSTRDSIIVNLLLLKKDSVLHSNFEIVPIRTINETARCRNGVYYRNIQTSSIPDELKDTIYSLTGAGKKDEKIIEARIRFLDEKISSIKKIIFPNKNIDSIKISGQK